MAQLSPTSVDRPGAARLGAALAGLGLALGGLYAARRRIAARVIGLRPAEHAVRVERHIAVPMPDGTVLYADHYAPSGRGEFPTILVRTPYGRGSELGIFGLVGDESAHLFAERGYHVIAQGVRGRYRSGGRFEPFVNEAADGRATLDWIAAQPWFDGSLGMWGPSYLGYAQWAVAADAPPFLKALVPLVTSARFSRLFYPEGAFTLESALRWAYIIHSSVSPSGSMGLAELLKVHPSRMAPAIAAGAAAFPEESDIRAIGQPVEFFRGWLSDRDPEGEYWRRVDHHRGLGRVGAAIHLVAGWYDIFLAGQLHDYAALLAAGRAPYLTVLPIAHMDASLVADGVREGLWWFDAHLRGRSELLERRPVRLHLMGSRERHEMDFWPPPAAFTRLYLGAGGSLEPSPAAGGHQSCYTYDPADPTPYAGGAVLSHDGGPRNQRAIESRPDVLTFTTPPLEQDLDIVGFVRLELFVRPGRPVCDFVGRLCAVDAAGVSLNICDGLFRVEPGKGETQPDGSLRIEVDLHATARRFARGQRLRLQVCSAIYPRISSIREGAPFEQTILHDADHPSALVLPVVNHAQAPSGASEKP